MGTILGLLLGTNFWYFLRFCLVFFFGALRVSGARLRPLQRARVPGSWVSQCLGSQSIMVVNTDGTSHPSRSHARVEPHVYVYI